MPVSALALVRSEKAVSAIPEHLMSSYMVLAILMIAQTVLIPSANRAPSVSLLACSASALTVYWHLLVLAQTAMRTDLQWVLQTLMTASPAWYPNAKFAIVQPS
jgi:hypothetical protein